MKTRLVHIVVAAAAAASFGVHPPARGAIAAGVLDGSPAGYLGCVIAQSSPHAVFCFAVSRVPSGENAGLVEVWARAYPNPLSMPVYALLTEDALTADVSDRGAPLVRFSGEVPEIGFVDWTARGAGSTADVISNEGCVGHPIHFDVTAASRGTADYVQDVSGTVAGRAVTNVYPCEGAVFNGATTGAWRIARGA